MELTHPAGALLLGGIPVLWWLFRRRERLERVVSVSTRRWFVAIAPRQAPLWRWWLWPLLLAGTAWFGAAAWAWMQPRARLPLTVTDVRDEGLAMPEGSPWAGAAVRDRGEWVRWLAGHPGPVRLHTNLQVAAWGESVDLPERVTVAAEPLPASVGISTAGFVGDTIWAQVHNDTGRPWSGAVTAIDADTGARASVQAAMGGDGGVVMIPGAGMGRVRLTVAGAGPWAWDRVFLLQRPSGGLRVACDASNPYLRTWARLWGNDPGARVLITETFDPAAWAAVTRRGGTVVWFAGPDCREALARLGIAPGVPSAVRERGVHVGAAWDPELGGLRSVHVTTWSDSAGWADVPWASEGGRPIVGLVPWSGGRVCVFMGPLHVPETELPTLPVFIPLLARMAQVAPSGDAAAGGEGGGPEGSSPLSWIRDPRIAPHWEGAVSLNHDRAFLQPVAAAVRREADAPVAQADAGWTAFTLASAAVFTLLLAYTWLRRL